MTYPILQSLLEEIYAKKIDNAPSWEPSHAEDNYKIGKVTFSAKDGLGSVPFNQSVYYHGLVAMVKPSTFLQLALPHQEERLEAADKLVQLVNRGYALGIPFFNLSLEDVENGKLPKIKGHEGRGRMLAIQKLNGDDPIPVHLLLTGGLRSRNITKNHLEAINKAVEAEGGGIIKDPFEGLIVSGKEV